LSDYTIETVNLTKKFAGLVAVNALSLQIKKGEIFALVGPDGAGKTTTMRMLSAIMDPTEGEARVVGYDVRKDGEKIRENIAYMSQKFGLYEDLTVVENMLFYADLYEIPQKERPPLIDRLLGFSNMTPFRNRLAGNLSGGMKQKLGLSCALIHKPQALLLDEPTNGVDPISRREFWGILYELLQEKVTIFVSTAYLDEAERANRVGLLHRGNLLLCDTPRKVQEEFPGKLLKVKTSNNREANKIMKQNSAVIKCNIFGEALHLIVKKDFLHLDTLWNPLKEKAIDVRNYSEIKPSLEDSFMSLIEGVKN